MTAYYNEHDPFAAAWLRELIAEGLIAPGEVDERSIEDVRPDELVGFDQCHWFAGIGGWSYALRLAGIPDDYPIWTGSCPCQPFSAAGKRGGFDDERHLWPAFHWHIAQSRPPVVIGEQVASSAADPWLDLVQADLEQMGYAFGCIAFPAASVGAPHIRDRAYWVADSDGEGLAQFSRDGGKPQPQGLAENGTARHLADTPQGGQRSGTGLRDTGPGEQRGIESADECGNGGVGNTVRNRNAPDTGAGYQQEVAPFGEHRGTAGAGASAGDAGDDGHPGPLNGFWRAADWLYCRDGKWRPARPGSFPLAAGIPNRVGALRGAGNAIVPAQAAEFIRALFTTDESAGRGM